MVLVAKSKPKLSPHHKKRSGQHHKQSKHYAKPYWPYLPLLLVVGIGLLLNGFWNRSSHAVLGASTAISASSLLDSTNRERSQYHEPNLQLNARLAQAAQAKAADMARRNYWSHNTPDGRTPWSFMASAGYDYQAAGENLAYGFTSSATAIAGWMNSPEHRANLLGGAYKDVGFGIAEAPDYQGKGPETVIVAMYGAPATDAQTGAAAAAVTSAPITSQPVARVQAFSAASDSASWLLLVMLAAAGGAAAIFIARHMYFVRRAWVYSEAFVVKHRWFDVVLISVITGAVILTRTAGFIQ